ncbi:MAG TPA: hypothetical protein VM186_07675 [Planctomycetota bacterium]|nr:hypothetical protein [Planctomycetota bacterium]
MTATVSRRLALTVLIALAAYMLACVWSPIAWSPDSSKIVFLDGQEEERNGEKVAVHEIWSGDIVSLRCTKLYESTAALSAPAYSPDGKRVAFLEMERGKQEPRAVYFVTLVPGEAPVKHRLPGINGEEDGLVYWVTVSWKPDGTMAAVTVPDPNKADDKENDFRLLIVNAVDGKLVWSRKGLLLGNWSPDGKWLAALGIPDENTLSVVLVSAGKFTEKRLCSFNTADEAEKFLATAPSWSPDGTQLCVCAPLKGRKCASVWRVNAATGETTVIAGTENAEAPAWSPDGKKIACAIYSDPDADDPGDEDRGNAAADGPARECHGLETEDPSSIVVIDVATGGQKLLARSCTGAPINRFPSWSPDGKWIAFRAGFKDGASWVGIASADGVASRVLFKSEEHALALLKCYLEAAEKEGDEDKKDELIDAARKCVDEIIERFHKTKPDAEPAEEHK